MVSSVGTFMAVSAAVAVAVSVVGYVRVRLRAAQVRRRHERFGERFKQSRFAEVLGWEEAETHPAPLDRNG